jgi:membrane protease YdiL (CAAX protease family)
LLVAFAGAVAVRVALAGPAGARSTSAALAFSAVLLAMAAAAGLRTSTSLGRSHRAVVVGRLAAAVLVMPAVLNLAGRSDGALTLPAGQFPAWAALTVVVAGAEEAFLRGALYDAVAARRGSDAAIVVAAAAFGLLHVPFYGWHALPLDFAVGLVLGVTRLVAGTWTAPAVAHIGADFAGWWLL